MSTASAVSGDAAATQSTTDDTFLFFLIALPLCLVSLLPAILARMNVLQGPADSYMATAPIAVLSPTIAAVLASRREAGRDGQRALFRQLRSWRANPLWYLLALALPGLVFAAGRAVYGVLPGNHGGPWAYFPTQAQHIAAMIVVPVGEEIGWRGFALPRLQRRYGAVKASVVLGLLWGIWHIPMYLASGAARDSYFVMLPYFLFGSFMFTWFYNRTSASVPLAIMLHVGAHLDAPGREGIDVTPLFIMTCALAALALMLVFGDRSAFPAARTEHSQMLGAINQA